MMSDKYLVTEEAFADWQCEYLKKQGMDECMVGFFPLKGEVRDEQLKIAQHEKTLLLAAPEIEAKARGEALIEAGTICADKIEEARKDERASILKIYNETIAVCPQAGLVAILQALSGKG